jgi:predicted HD phosphohydrolase
LLCQLNHIDILAYFLSSLLHDVGHPGLNNVYQQNRQTKLAMRYNDKSILENYHTYKGLRILNKSSSNILENLPQEEKKAFRKRYINCIFATDMAFHNNIISKVSFKIEKISGAIKAENSLISYKNEEKKNSDFKNTKIIDKHSNYLNEL